MVNPVTREVLPMRLFLATSRELIPERLGIVSRYLEAFVDL